FLRGNLTSNTIEYGDPALFTEYLWSRVFPEPMSGCWLWTAAATDLGYGRYAKNGKWYLAHRTTANAPEGKVVDHLCRTPACINPDHLEVTTQKVNVGRGLAPEKTRQINASKTHCK